MHQNVFLNPWPFSSGHIEYTKQKSKSKAGIDIYLELTKINFWVGRSGFKQVNNPVDKDLNYTPKALKHVLFLDFINLTKRTTFMFGTLIGKKKMTEQTLAKVLVSGSLRSCEPIFKEIVEYIKECPHFETTPVLTEDAELDFIITVFTCNITRIPHYMDHGRDKRIAQKVLTDLAESLDMDLRDVGKRIQSCKSLMKRLNHPSKNLIYAMPKALFDYYELNDYQQTYFKDLRSPNPLYLKEMNQMLDHVVWDWDFLKNEYKFVE